MGYFDSDLLPQRFWDKVSPEPNTGCWLWTGYIDRDGYGKFGFCGRTVRAHRLAYEVLIAEIPQKLVVDHLCRNPSCCNPEHLEPVTNRENVLRGAAEITHCPRGHEYSKANTRRYRGRRYCRVCDREKQSAKRNLAREQVPTHAPAFCWACYGTGYVESWDEPCTGELCSCRDGLRRRRNANDRASYARRKQAASVLDDQPREIKCPSSTGGQA